MKALYYYCYLLYTKVIPEDEPYATTVFVLSFLEAMFLFSTASLLLAYWQCFDLNAWYGVSLMVVLLIVNYVVFNRSGWSRRITEEKPMLFNSHRLSIVIFLFLFILSASSLFWGPVYTKHFLDGCR